MKKITASILSVILIGTLVTACGSSEEKAKCPTGQYVGQGDGKCHEFGSVSFNKSENSYSTNIKYACRHFNYLISNSDVLTYQEQIKEAKKVYTAASVAYSNGEWQSGSIYSASRIFYSAAIDDNFTDEAMTAGKELVDLCRDVPSW
jgi:hypothetical protein